METFPNNFEDSFINISAVVETFLGKAKKIYKFPVEFWMKNMRGQKCISKVANSENIHRILREMQTSSLIK